MYFNLTGPLHVLGRHDEELEEARKAVTTYRGVLNPRAFEARALAPMGRYDELNKVVEEVLTAGSQSYSFVYLHRGSAG